METNETGTEGNLEQMNETESSSYSSQSQLQQQRMIGQHGVIPVAFGVVYPLQRQPRMPLPVVIDASSRGSLGTIASLPEPAGI